MVDSKFNVTLQNDSNSNTSDVNVVDKTNIKNVLRHTDDYIDQDWDYELIDDNLKEELNSNTEEDDGTQLASKPKSRTKCFYSRADPKRCKECDILFETHEKFFEHRNDHSHSVVRGIRTKMRVYEYISYVPEKTMIEKKEQLKNHMVINIPPPDFTKEIASKCTFPKPVLEYVDEDWNTKWTKSQRGESMKCSACPTVLIDMDATIEHHLKYHKLKFKCPIEGCKYPLFQFFVDFSKHYFYHTEPLLQLQYPHECIGCDFKTPLLDKAEAHVRSMGKFHDNKCPRCDMTFSCRSDMTGHILIEGHQGVVCGHCAQVLESEIQLKMHHKNNLCSAKPRREKEEICDICGKQVLDYYLERHKISKHSTENDPQVCPDCGVLCKNKEYLEIVHKPACVRNQRAIERKPCPICGELVRERYMKIHNYKHNPQNKKPYVCEKCGKGFMDHQKLKDHLNIHEGIKPYKCKYCNAAFSDAGNKRMHERCVHEGYKRSK